MPDDFSFDIVSKVDEQELENAVNQAMKEIGQRFDFKGSKSQITINGKEKKVELVSDDEFKLNQVKDVLGSKLIKRGISLKALAYGTVEQAGGNTVRQTATLVQGLTQEYTKELVKHIKGLPVKAQASIQSDQIRVTSRSKDDLQTVMASLRGLDYKVPLQFTNFK